MNETPNKFWIFSICLALAITTVMVFWQVHNCDFITDDDPVYVTENYHVQTGLNINNIIWAFTTGHASNWHPLTWLSHTLDCQLFHTNPAWHHVVNLLFHIVNALLLFIVLTQMTAAVWPSAFVAALFALHPLHVQSVAWVAERKDVLSTFFWILAMICYLRYVKHPGIWRYLLTIFIFVLGLMSKPMLVTLPFVLLLIDYWPLERFNKTTFAHLILEKIPLFVLSAASCIVTFLVQQKGGATAAISKLPLNIRAANCFISYVKYIEKMFWPSGLAAFYPHPIHTIPVWQIILAVLFLLVVSILIVVFASKYKYLLVGWLWFLGTLVPVIGLVQVGEQAMADRYTYVPLIGLFILIAWGIRDLSARLRYRNLILGSTAFLTLSALSVCAYFQVNHWRNSYTIFQHALDVTENNYIAQHSLAYVLFSQGKLDQSIAYEYKALQMKPAFSPAYAGLGVVFLQKGRPDLSAKCFEKALEIEPNWPEVMNNLAWLLATYRGTAIYNPQRALQLAQQTCEINKYQDASSLDTLAAAYAATGNFTQAVSAAENALKSAKVALDKQLAEQIRQRLDMYRKGQPYVEPPSK